MPQSILVQVGRSGNQVGNRFWDIAVNEYIHRSVSTLDDMTHFFKIDDVVFDSHGFMDADVLKPRAVIIGTEEDISIESLKGSLRNVFQHRKIVRNVEGSAKNWAVGNMIWGPNCRNDIISLCRKEAEKCDNLHSFFIIHSVGEDTGSGLGSATLEYLSHEFPDVHRFVAAIYPSFKENAPSTYNALLANHKLNEHASCVFPFEDKTLEYYCARGADERFYLDLSLMSSLNQPIDLRSINTLLHIREHSPLNETSNLVANALINLTSSSRFPGCFQHHVRDFVMNMVPYQKLHYVVPSLSPLFSEDANSIWSMCQNAFSPDNQFFPSLLSRGILLSSTLLCRGNFRMTDVEIAIEKIKSAYHFPSWIKHNWNVGIIPVPHLTVTNSVLLLHNTTSIAKCFMELKDMVLKMFYKKAYLRPFLDVQGMDAGVFLSAYQDLAGVINEYKTAELAMIAAPPPPPYGSLKNM